MRKSFLRPFAQKALQKQGLSSRVRASAGSAPGARLEADTEIGPIRFAVKASVDREVGFARRPDGKWSPVASVEAVLVVAPSMDRPGFVEVACFDRASLTRALDNQLAKRQRDGKVIDKKMPIFLALDSEPGGKSERGTGLLNQATWVESIAVDDIPAKSRIVEKKETPGIFIERVKREYAELSDVPVARVRVDFRIVDEADTSGD